MLGTIARILPEQGSGYITPDEEGGEIFFHRNALHDVEYEDLEAGVAVEFTLGYEEGAQPNEALRAVDVRLPEVATPSTEHEALPAEKLSTA